MSELERVLANLDRVAVQLTALQVAATSAKHAIQQLIEVLPAGDTEEIETRQKYLNLTLLHLSQSVQHLDMLPAPIEPGTSPA